MRSRAAWTALTAVLVLGACGSDAGAPPPDRGRVTIEVEWPGAAPADIETTVTAVIEERVGGLAGIAGIESRSLEGVAIIDVVPSNAEQLDVLAQQVQDAVAEMPIGLVPTVRRSPAGTRQARAVVTNPMQAEDAKRRIERHVGVLGVRVCGVREPRLEVRPDLARLAALGATVTDVAEALRGLPLGSGVGSLDAVLLQGADHSEVHLGDVAAVTATEHEACHLGGSPFAGAVLVVEVTGRDARERWADALADARADGIEVVDLSAARTLTATIEPAPGGRAAREVDAVELRALAESVDAIDGVRWALATRDDDAAAVQLAIGLETVDAIAAVDAAVTALLATPRALPLRMTGSVPGVEAVLRGPDLDALHRAAASIVEALRAKQLPAGCDPCDRPPALSLAIDRARAADYGITVATVAQTLRILAPEVVASWRSGTTETAVVLALGVDDDVPRTLAQLRVRDPNGALIPLDALVRVDSADASTAILHRDRERAVIVWTRGAKARSALDAAIAAAAAPGIRTTVRTVY